jgi:glucokinase-like ROK family protein
VLPMKNTTSGPTSIRVINCARLISLVRRNPGVTRSQLSQMSGLSKGTVSILTAEMIGKELLSEDSERGSKQRNNGLFLGSGSEVAIGIEVSPDECRGVLTDLSMRCQRRAERQLSSSRVDITIATILLLVDDLLVGRPSRCLGVGVAVPGPTDAGGKTVVFSESMGWSDVPLAQKLQEQLTAPVTVVNRPRAGVLGEHWYGAGVGFQDVIYVSISSGIAAGILMGGQLLTGSYGFSGELGHTTMLLDGPQCVCGNRGCLEAVASLPAVVQAVRQRAESGESSEWHERLQANGHLVYQDIVAAARGGDPLVLDEVRKASRYIGVAVANLIDLFNPSCVIIGGRLAEAGEIVLNTVRETAQRRAFPVSYAGVRIVRNALGLDSVAVGACALVVDRYVSELQNARLIDL